MNFFKLQIHGFIFLWSLNLQIYGLSSMFAYEY